ncbi:MAG: hypothetical protein L0332_24175 [Chloroflexi bacterium]|nr:hypothetical protein [Chloroflexota bacterium]MCI0729792.1 hypothetical protein [Chloroflexota bacterium]
MTTEQERIQDIFLTYLTQKELLLPQCPQQLLDSNNSLREALCAACFLANTGEGVDVRHFLDETVPLLLRQLNRTTEQQQVQYINRIRGKVDWPATYKARYHNEHNLALFVCHQPLRQNDTLENQLLKYMLSAIEQLLPCVPDILLSAARWSAGLKPNWMRERLEAMLPRLRLLRNHIRLREVTLPPFITVNHLLRARTSKIGFYGLVAQLYEQYEGIVLHTQWEYIRPVFRQTLLLPTDEEGDIYLRIAATSFLESALNWPKRS